MINPPKPPKSLQNLNAQENFAAGQINAEVLQNTIKEMLTIIKSAKNCPIWIMSSENYHILQLILNIYRYLIPIVEQIIDDRFITGASYKLPCEDKITKIKIKTLNLNISFSEQTSTCGSCFANNQRDIFYQSKLTGPLSL